MITEDPGIFLADWGEDGVLDGETVRLLFVEPYAVAPLGDAGMATAEPRALLPSSSVPARASAPANAELVLDLSAGAALRYLGGVPFRYRVREVQPDGTGWTSLILIEHESQS